ncbi:MAG: hypothetical protein WC223_11875 [Bacteroidales bacterium]|jgi:hypothetical protein
MLRIKNVTITVLLSIFTTITANILIVFGILYQGYLYPSLTRVLAITNLFAFTLFFANYWINLFGKEKLIRIKADRMLGIIYFVVQCFFILFLLFPLLLWVVGFFEIGK